MALSSYLEAALLNHVVRGEVYTPPTTVYLALFTSSATEIELESGDLTNELAGYTRQPVTFAAATVALGAAEAANDALLTFSGLPAATLTRTALIDAATGGNVLFHGALAIERTTTEGETISIDIGRAIATLA